MLVGGQNHGLGHRDADTPGQHVIEELVVGRPPEGVVDDDRAFRGELLQDGAVERNVLADAVEDQS
jgi:hypothetical protein